MQKITPFLWFDGNAEEAITFYSSVFKDAAVKKMVRYGAGGPGEPGTLMTAEFSLNGQDFIALNGGPHFKFTEAISFVITCHSQEEVDYFWDRLTDGGQPSQCGWLKDQFGLSWQVVPTALTQLLSQSDKERAGRVMQAMLKMKKIEINTLEKASAGEFI